MRNEYDRLIERYMAGEMSALEEQKFLERASNDRQLANLLRAEQAIISGTQKDRSRMPVAPMEPGARLLAKLAATQAYVHPFRPATAHHGMSGFRNSTVQAALAAAIMLGIVIGAFIIAPLASPDEEMMQPSRPGRETIPAPQSSSGKDSMEGLLEKHRASTTAMTMTDTALQGHGEQRRDATEAQRTINGTGHPALHARPRAPRLGAADTPVSLGERDYRRSQANNDSI